MKRDCPKCKGEGELECEHCNQTRHCPECKGEGCVDECISTFDIPKDWKKYDQLNAIQKDALNCRAQHAKLCSLNPKARESYDQQLADILKKLNAEASELEP